MDRRRRTNPIGQDKRIDAGPGVAEVNKVRASLARGRGQAAERQRANTALEAGGVWPPRHRHLRGARRVAGPVYERQTDRRHRRSVDRHRGAPPPVRFRLCSDAGHRLENGQDVPETPSTDRDLGAPTIRNDPDSRQPGVVHLALDVHERRVIGPQHLPVARTRECHLGCHRRHILDRHDFLHVRPLAVGGHDAHAVEARQQLDGGGEGAPRELRLALPAVDGHDHLHRRTSDQSPRNHFGLLVRRAGACSVETDPYPIKTEAERRPGSCCRR